MYGGTRIVAKELLSNYSKIGLIFLLESKILFTTLAAYGLKGN
jgi:hypothetical protein